MLQQMMLILCPDRQHEEASMHFKKEKQMKLREKTDVRKGQEIGGEKGIFVQNTLYADKKFSNNKK